MAVNFSRLHGRISGGMFPNEIALVVRDHFGRQYVIIVPKDLVEGEGDTGTIKVRVIDSANGISLVTLPGEHLDSGGTISVPDSELTPA